MSRSVLPVLALSALAVAACDLRDTESMLLLEELRATGYTENQEYCACFWRPAGYLSADACYWERTDALPEYSDYGYLSCIDGAYQRDRIRSEEHLSCLLDVRIRYVECQIAARCDLSRLRDCDDLFDRDWGRCPVLDPSVERGLDACDETYLP